LFEVEPLRGLDDEEYVDGDSEEEDEKEKEFSNLENGFPLRRPPPIPPD